MNAPRAAPPPFVWAFVQAATINRLVTLPTNPSVIS
jgi:uncharacterized membrane protein YadS